MMMFLSRKQILYVYAEVISDVNLSYKMTQLPSY